MKCHGRGHEDPRQGCGNATLYCIKFQDGEEEKERKLRCASGAIYLQVWGNWPMRTAAKLDLGTRRDKHTLTVECPRKASTHYKDLSTL